MRTLKFVTSDKNHHHFASAVRRNVNDYFKEEGISTKGNWSLRMQTIIMLSLYIIPFALLFALPINAWIAALMTVVMGIGMAGIGMTVMHGAAHGSYSDKTWVNNLFASTMY